MGPRGLGIRWAIDETRHAAGGKCWVATAMGAAVAIGSAVDSVRRKSLPFSTRPAISSKNLIPGQNQPQGGQQPAQQSTPPQPPPAQQPQAQAPAAQPSAAQPPTAQAPAAQPPAAAAPSGTRPISLRLPSAWATSSSGLFQAGPTSTLRRSRPAARRRMKRRRPQEVRLPGHRHSRGSFNPDGARTGRAEPAVTALSSFVRACGARVHRQRQGCHDQGRCSGQGDPGSGWRRRSASRFRCAMHSFTRNWGKRA